MAISASVVEQAVQCLANLESALRAVGCSLADVVRVRYMLADASEFSATWPVLREAFGTARPAATMIQCGLADPRMRIEIEVEAVVGAGSMPVERVHL